MNEYDNSLILITTKLQEFFKKYDAMENSEPFSYTILNILRQYLESYKANVTQALKREKHFDSTYNSMHSILKKDYETKDKELAEKRKKDIEQIKQKYQDKYDALKDEIKQKELEIHFEENTILMDIDFFFAASEQNVEVFEREFNENLARFNYQIQIASDAYESNTIHYNDILENDLKNLSASHASILTQNDKDSERIINHYRKKVQELNQVLENKMQEFNTYQEDIKNKKRKESIDLNDKIRALMDVRNEKNLYAKRNYNRQQAEAQEDKEIKQQEYQLENQKISKEFVINMSKLDEMASTLKQNLDRDIDSEKRHLQYRLLELKNEQEKELINAFSSQKSKRHARSINKQYAGYGTIEKRNTEKSIKHLNQDYLKNVQIINYQKKLLDLDRSYDIKSIIENEAYENKRFQEINNNYEIDMNLAIELNNLEFTKSSNEMRLYNSLKSLKDERNYDEIDALHQIEEEKLIYQIKALNCEIESFEKIQQILHKYEDDKYRTTYNFKTVNTVLEIEKYKVLNNLNHSMYDINVKSTQSILDNSKKSIDLKNKEYEYKNKSRIQRNQMVLNDERELVNYQIECFKRDEALELSILNRNYFFELDTLGHNYLSEKFKLEYKRLLQGYQTLTKIFVLTKGLIVQSINTLLNSIQYRPEYVKKIWAFFKEYLQILFASYKEYFRIYSLILEETIKNRLNLEKDVKYRGFYKNTESKYKADLQVFTKKKDHLNKEFQENEQTIEQNRSTLFALDNDIYVKRKEIQKRKNPKTIESLNETYNLYHQLEAENLKLTKKNAVLQREITQLDQQISQINLSYTRQQDDIRKMQVTNAQSYNELKKNMDKQIASTISSIQNRIKLENTNIEITEYEQTIREKSSIFLTVVSSFLTDGYEIFNKFKVNEIEAISKSASILKNGYTTDLEEIDEEAKIERMTAKAIFIREQSQRSEDIQKFDVTKAQTIEEIKQSIINHESLIKKINEDFQKEKEKTTRVFYSEYYAICNNQKDIIAKQEKDMAYLQEQYNKDRNNIFEQFKKSKNDLKEALQEYIHSRNDIIHHLPTAERAQEKNIKEDASNTKVELTENFSNTKIQSQASKREVQKNIDMIKSAFQIKQLELQREYKINRLKEKREHLKQMRRI